MQRFNKIEQNRILVTLWEDNLNVLIIGDKKGNIDSGWELVEDIN